jgi:hypothetical protein
MPHLSEKYMKLLNKMKMIVSLVLHYWNIIILVLEIKQKWNLKYK